MGNSFYAARPVLRLIAHTVDCNHQKVTWRSVWTKKNNFFLWLGTPVRSFKVYFFVSWRYCIKQSLTAGVWGCWVWTLAILGSDFISPLTSYRHRRSLGQRRWQICILLLCDCQPGQAMGCGPLTFRSYQYCSLWTPVHVLRKLLGSVRQKSGSLHAKLATGTVHHHQSLSASHSILQRFCAPEGCLRSSGSD